MSTQKSRASFLCTALVLAAAWLLPALPAAAQSNCLPTCTEDDGRFLVIAAGASFSTLSDPILDLTLVVPAGTSDFEIGIFDGDAQSTTGFVRPNAGGVFHWDSGVPGRPIDAPVPPPIFEFVVYADPAGNVSGTQVVAGPYVGTSVFGANQGVRPECTRDVSTDLPGPFCLTDNAWVDIPISTGPEAQTTSGDYVYRLHIELMNADQAITANSFKVRTSEFGAIEPIAQPFGYQAQIATAADDAIIYPPSGFPCTPLPSCSTYDGNFSFFIEAQAPQSALSVWDGDFDRGKFDGTDQDTNDPNTPGTPFEPIWATIDTVPEGVAVGRPGPPATTGDPPDDITTPNSSRNVRDPSIFYDLVLPDGTTSLRNDNPSGNQEWEEFKVVATGSPADAGGDCSSPDASRDCDVDELPSGIYEIAIQGVDMANLNFFLTPFRILCVQEDGSACERPSERPRFQVGDTVFEDDDGDGVQDPGEPGLPGVIVLLLGEDGNVIDATVTDADGKYSFTVDSGGTDEGGDPIPVTYTVEVAGDNFGAAAGGEVGDKVWLDADGNGLEGAGEPGIPNVTVHLFEVGGDGMAGTADDVFVAATNTDAEGRYLFAGLGAGTYYTTVVAFTVPSGLELSGGTDPSATRTITAGGACSEPDCLDLDFGYRSSSTTTALVGDYVWSDADGDGVQDAGEAGIANVTLELLLAIPGPCPMGATCRTIGSTLYQVVGETQTDAGGSYLFAGVAPGTYRVDVTDTAAVLTGYSLTGGVDPTAAFTVAAGDVLLDKDFGYRNVGLADITDTVWLDADRNGLLDGAEMGIPGVTVNLVDERGDVVATTTSGAAGEIVFNDLPDGVYAIEITDLGGVLAAYVATTTASARLFQDVVLPDLDPPGDVDPSFAGVNFGWVGGGALEEYEGTTIKDPVGDVNRQTDTVAGADVEDYDFGYTRGSIGDRVWLDVDGDGVQDAFEPGLNGVTLHLSGAGADVTAGDGDYLFNRLDSGNYTVEVDATIALFGGLIPSFDFDDPAPPIGTPDEASVTLAVAEDNPDVDFGYTFDPDAFGFGCTPGYWKNHTNSWNPTPYAPGEKFNDVFGVFDPADPTLLQALQNENESFPALNRHGVAALLNASHPEGGYLYSPELVILIVKYGYDSGEWETMKNLLERQNESPLGCLVDDVNTGKLPDGIFADGFESGGVLRWRQ